VLLHVAAVADAPCADLAAALDGLATALASCWDALDALARHRRTGALQSWQEVCQVVNWGMQVTTERQWFADQQTVLSATFADRYAGKATEWARINADLAWCRDALRRHAGATPPDAFVRLVAAETVDSVTLARCTNAAMRLTEQLAALATFWQQSDTTMPRAIFHPAGTDFVTTPLVLLRKRVHWIAG